jgi:hypothetical protein
MRQRRYWAQALPSFFRVLGGRRGLAGCIPFHMLDGALGCSKHIGQGRLHRGRRGDGSSTEYPPIGLWADVVSTLPQPLWRGSGVLVCPKRRDSTVCLQCRLRSALALRGGCGAAVPTSLPDLRQRVALTDPLCEKYFRLHAHSYPTSLLGMGGRVSDTQLPHGRRRSCVGGDQRPVSVTAVSASHGCPTSGRHHLV